MAIARRHAIAIGLGLGLGMLMARGAAGAGLDGPVELRKAEPDPAGAVHARVELTARGTFRPEAKGAEGAAGAKGLGLRVQTRFDFIERPLPGDTPRRVRLVNQAAAAIDGEVRPSSRGLREEVSVLVAGRDRDGVGSTFSPGGPLTRAELDLVQGPGDPLDLGGLLPREAVSGPSRPPSREALAFELVHRGRGRPRRPGRGRWCSGRCRRSGADVDPGVLDRQDELRARCDLERLLSLDRHGRHGWTPLDCGGASFSDGPTVDPRA